MAGIGMKVAVLSENTAQPGLTPEHGLSLMIEYQGRRILLDTGKSEAFVQNAKEMGVDLTHLDACVLSHGHYDHSSGYDALFRQDPDLTVYAQSSALEDHLSGIGGMHDIGVPETIRTQRERFFLLDGPLDLFPGVSLVPHSTPGLAAIGERAQLYCKVQGQIVPDDFAHEQSLVFDTPNGLVVFNSCSHGGAGSIIREARARCGDKPVYAYVGGLHMIGRVNGEETCAFSDQQVDALCRDFLEAGVLAIYTGHCTGQPGYEKLSRRLGDRLHRLTTGLQFVL